MVNTKKIMFLFCCLAYVCSPTVYAGKRGLEDLGRKLNSKYLEAWDCSQQLGEELAQLSASLAEATDAKRIAYLNEIIDSKRRELDDSFDSRKRFKDVGSKGSKAMIGLEESDVEIEKALGITAIEQGGKTQRLERVLEFLREPRNIGYIVAGTASVILSYYVIKHGVGITAHYIESKLGRPDIIKESSTQSLLERMFSGQKEESRLQEFIAAPVLKAELHNIAHDVLKARLYGDNLSSMLLYGPPGTGKTMFAKALALHSGLDWALIPGASLSKLDTKEALAKINQILKWARNSKKGMILIFDEVENFLKHRGDASMSEGSRKLVTEFLAYVEKPSDKKLMFVMTTNRPQDLDPAAVSRVGRLMHVSAPEHRELVDLIKLYVPKVKKSGIELSESIESTFNELAGLSKGLVGRDIEEIFTTQVVQEVRRSGKNILTADIAKSTLERYRQARREKDVFAEQEAAEQQGVAANAA